MPGKSLRPVIRCAALVLAMVVRAVGDPVEEPAPVLPADLLGGLGAESFAERQGTQQKLLEWSRKCPEAAKDLLFHASQAAEEPEVRERCLGVLRELVRADYLLDGQGFMGIAMGFAVQPLVLPGEQDPRFTIRIDRVEADSPASKAGLVIGDLILGINDRRWALDDTPERITGFIKQFKPGTKVKVLLAREGKLVDLTVELGRRPAIADVPRMLFFGGLQVQGLGAGGAMPTEEEVEAAENRALDEYFRAWLARKKAAAK